MSAGLVLGALGGAAATWASARWNWWRPRAAGVPALMYHNIGAAPAGSKIAKLWVAEADFERQLLTLKAGGWTTVTLREAAAAAAGAGRLPERAALITFDDGYRNNYDKAFPLLKKHGMKANIFLVVDALGGHNAWHDPSEEPWQRMLTWAQVAEMERSGLVDFGSHTMTHPVLPRLDDETARWELAESRRRLEDRLGRAVHALAYPFGAGAYDARIRGLAREAGYTLDFGIKQGLCAWPPAADAPLRRVLVRGDDTRFDFHLNLTRGRARL